MMEISKTVLISIYVAIGLYLMYKIFFRKDPYKEEYEKLYNKILNSEEHKVKGQYNK